MNYVNQFDFVCLTETFLDSSFDFSYIFTDYLKFHVPAKKFSFQGRNSGGVLLLVRKRLEKFVSRINLECDNTIAVKVDKCVFDTNKDVIVIATYVVPEGGPLYDDKVVKDGILILEEALLQQFNKDNDYFIILGDLNARTAHKQAELEVMSNYVYDENEGMDGENSGRSSKDSIVNKFGKTLLHFCLLFDVIILNGFCNGDKEGECTFVSPNGASVIDYFLIPDVLLTNFDLRVGDRVDSWHLPVEVTWKKNNDSMNVDNDATQQGGEKIVWTDECANVYKNELESDEFLNSLFMATNVLSTNVNDGLNQFVNALYSAAACMVRSVGHNIKQFNDWFDYECIRKRKEVKRLLKRAQRCKKEKEKKKRICSISKGICQVKESKRNRV